MNVSDAIRGRRSIKPDKMKSDPIDRSLLDEMFEAANWAPTHGLTEPWRFVVFTGDARRALGEAIVTTMTPPGQDTLPAEDARSEKAIRNVMTPPVTIAIICSPSSSPKIVPHEELLSTAIATQNMMLTARARGLGTYWSSGDKAFHPRMAKFLGIAPPAQCLGFLYVGWPRIEWPEGVRRAASDKVTWRA